LDLEANQQFIERQFRKWKGVCMAYKNPILESDVGQTSFENKRKAYKAHVVSTKDVVW
jgi:hypothetical protein